MSSHARPIGERLLERAVGEGECLVWTGTVNNQGYGQIGSGGRHGAIVSTHRVAYQLAFGPIPAGLDVCHSCDNRRCIRSEHLFVGTRSENMRDAQAKGRTRNTLAPGHTVGRGENNGQAKLTEAQVREIRRLIAEGAAPFTEIGARFGVGQPTVSDIKSGRQWAHVQPDGPTHATGSRGSWRLS